LQHGEYLGRFRKGKRIHRISIENKTIWKSLWAGQKNIEIVEHRECIGGFHKTSAFCDEKDRGKVLVGSRHLEGCFHEPEANAGDVWQPQFTIWWSEFNPGKYA